MAVAKVFTTITGSPRIIPSRALLGLPDFTYPFIHPHLCAPMPWRMLTVTYHFPSKSQPVVWGVCLLPQTPAGLGANPRAATIPTKVFFGPWRATGFPPVYKTLEVVTAMMGPQTPRKFPVLPFARS